MKIPLSGKADWECRHYLHRKALARGLRLYLIESEMRSLNQTWVFPVYSAYNDNAYNEHLIKIDEYRIRVFNVKINGKFKFVNLGWLYASLWFILPNSWVHLCQP